MTKAKICGLTELEDARLAVDCGADALGFVFAPSPRRISPERAAEIIAGLPASVVTVGLFVNEEPETVEQVVAVSGVSAVQLHGEEPPAVVAELAGCGRLRRGDFGPVIKALRVADADSLDAIESYPEASAFLLDAYCPDRPGGTGQRFDWALARQAVARGRPIILAGGLDPDNVARAIAEVRPFAVDVSSGVEASPGRKDPEKLRRFLRVVKG